MSIACLLVISWSMEIIQNSMEFGDSFPSISVTSIRNFNDVPRIWFECDMCLSRCTSLQRLSWGWAQLGGRNMGISPTTSLASSVCLQNSLCNYLTDWKYVGVHVWAPSTFHFKPECNIGLNRRWNHHGWLDQKCHKMEYFGDCLFHVGVTRLLCTVFQRFILFISRRSNSVIVYYLPPFQAVRFTSE